MNDAEIVEETITYVREALKDSEGGHDWFHIQRVFRNTLLIAKDEEVDVLVVSLAALLHDIADPKFHDGNEEIGPEKASTFLEKLKIPEGQRDHVIKIIRHMSFKNTLDSPKNPFDSKELHVVRDADRLDAMGAIGIARAFNFGGFAGRKLYDPEIAPNPKMDKAAYKKNTGPTINHFYEKLLLLKDLMHTKTGKRLAERRHQFMLDFLEEFYNEWNGKA
ncbi:HD domain-containing protein [Robiginitalea aurantiaca]|uniref:HD domain-containing protein n=1 Tax=Robiginitalea aurantiaca TaxID=3056915 RepID=A0ABT7WAS2_9FLAO|nr:HD domain-containing protein [Robiginitalea aurantiaca]MDM9630017.1 HD domain-containing protein [Robiginitalea aurantiaca]